MKKIYFFAALAAVALASCSNDEVVQTTQTSPANEINFRPLMGNVTRAVEKTAFANNDVISIRANFGSADYFNDTYTFDGTNFKPTTATTHYYWPSDLADADGKRMTFYATYPNSVAAQTGDGAFALTDYDAETDILFAKKVVTTKPSDGVSTMNFRHALSEIDVKVKNTNAGLEVTITGVRVGFIARTASFSCDELTEPKITSATGTSIPNLAQTCWTRINPTSADADKYTKETGISKTLTGAVTTAQAIDDDFTPWMFIPQNLETEQGEGNPAYENKYASNAKGTAVSAPNLKCAYVALKMTIKNNDDAKTGIVAEQWCYWPIYTSWEPGKKYTYIIDVAGGGYQPTNVDETASDELDPVLKGLEIWFDANSIDTWITDIDEDGTADDIPVSGGI